MESATTISEAPVEEGMLVPSPLMESILKNSPTPPSQGDIVEGVVIGKAAGAVFVSLSPFGTGIIYGREYLNARDIIKKINFGDSITAKVVEPENENGYIELSLKEARQAVIWSEADAAIKNKESFLLLVKDANKGGLILEWQGIAGFLPASQLKAEHYPRVADADKEKIMEELKKFVGTKFSVSIIAADPKEGKLIFSEKVFDQKERQEIVGKYAIGDQVEGVVTGVVDFGLFMRIEENLEGLVHISEIDWSLVDNPRSLYKTGDRVSARVIEIKDGKISLSIKALKPNPWLQAAEKYKKGDEVSGVVLKYNKHGALVSIEEGVAGLAHISDFASPEELQRTLEIGKTYPFKITLFDAKEQKMTLSLVRNATEKKN